MKKSDVLDRLVRAEKGVRWTDGEVNKNWSAVRSAVRSGRKALPIAIAPLALGLHPLIAKAAIVTLAVSASAGATYVAYRVTEEPQVTAIETAPARAGASKRNETPRGAPSPTPTAVTAIEPPDGKGEEHPGTDSKPHATSASGLARNGDSLANELTLLREAKRCLDGGDFNGARGALREHATRFPAGVITDERHALELILECSEGGSGTAARRAERYVATHPRSIHRDSIARSCKLGGQPDTGATRTSSHAARSGDAPPATLTPQESQNATAAAPQTTGKSTPPTGEFPIAE